MRQIALILNNIRSNQNVGSIFRTADAAGVYKIYICGYTPAPIDKFERVNRALSKASLGAEKFVEWEKVSNFSVAVKKLKQDGFRVIAVEQNKKAIDYRKIKKSVASSQYLVFVLGNEVKGLSEKDLSLCDMIVEIPMKGKKESLNMAVAAGIVLYELI